MFQQLKNIETAFSHIRLFSLVLIIANIITSCYTVYKCHTLIDRDKDRIYLIVNGKAIEAVAGSRKDNIPIEAKDHIKVFHQYFFTLTPDEKAMEDNIKNALYMADKTAKEVYDNLKESGYFSQVVGASISQDIAVDSIIVNTDSHPYYFRFYGKVKIVRPTSITIRSLVTEGYLRNLDIRTDNNPHGFLIEKWATLENKDIDVKRR